ncbi:acyl-CoA dehydrogenase family protein [Streptomyces anulatus]
MFDNDHDDFRAAVRAFVNRELRTRQVQFIQKRPIDRWAWLAAGKQGLLGLLVPEENGGSGAGDYWFSVWSEELARHASPEHRPSTSPKTFDPNLGADLSAVGSSWSGLGPGLQAQPARPPDDHRHGLGAYPFVAEGALGAEDIFIGRDGHAEAVFCFDFFSLCSSGRFEGFANPGRGPRGDHRHGQVGAGEATATRSVAHSYRIYIPCAPKGVWTLVAQALSGFSIALGPGLRGQLNPLNAPPRPRSVSKDDWSTEVRKRRLLLLVGLARTVLKRDLLPMEHTALDLPLDLVVAEAAARGTVPLLGEIAHALDSPERLEPLRARPGLPESPGGGYVAPLARADALFCSVTSVVAPQRAS